MLQFFYKKMCIYYGFLSFRSQFNKTQTHKQWSTIGGEKKSDRRQATQTNNVVQCRLDVLIFFLPH